MAIRIYFSLPLTAPAGWAGRDILRGPNWRSNVRAADEGLTTAQASGRLAIGDGEVVWERDGPCGTAGTG